MALLRNVIAARAGWKRVLPLMRDKHVPTALKAGAIAMGLLIISPLDVFSDIPVLGLLDDALLLTILCGLFVFIAGKYAEGVTLKNVTPSGVSSTELARR